MRSRRAFRRISFGRALRELREDMGRLPARVLARKTWDKIAQDDVLLFATTFAYFWLFAIPALLILIVMLAALLNQATTVPVVENLRDMIHDQAPIATRQLLLDQVDAAVIRVGSNAASLGAIVTAIVAIWSASGAVAILMKGFNRAYEVQETRSYLHRRAITVGLTLLIVIFTNVAIGLLIFGQRLGNWLAGQLGLGESFDQLWNIVRLPSAIAGIMFVLAMLYWAGPNVRQSFRWVSPGSIFATTLWIAVVAGFGIYLALTKTGSAYGVLGSIIVLLVFLNFTGIVFFLGAEVNAVLYKVALDAMYPGPHLGHDPIPFLPDG
jgi:membrane protein